MNYLLDTNVVSELRKRTPHPQVTGWAKSVPDGATHLSVLTIGEIRQGIERRRRKDSLQAHVLEEWLSQLESAYTGKILPITMSVAGEWGRLDVPAPLPPVDGLLAATAKVHGMTLVTRNTKDIERTGVRLRNPFVFDG